MQSTLCVQQCDNIYNTLGWGLQTNRQTHRSLWTSNEANVANMLLTSAQIYLLKTDMYTITNASYLSFSFGHHSLSCWDTHIECNTNFNLTNFVVNRCNLRLIKYNLE